MLARWQGLSKMLRIPQIAAAMNAKAEAEDTSSESHSNKLTSIIQSP
jgi:hypothetical protein